MTVNELGTRRYQKFAEQVRRRDRFTCQICGDLGRTVDHIIPRHLGGALRDPGNARTLCRLCNLIKGGSRMTDAEVLAARRLREAGPPAARRSYGSIRRTAIAGPRSTVITRDYTRPRL